MRSHLNLSRAVFSATLLFSVTAHSAEPTAPAANAPGEDIIIGNPRKISTGGKTAELEEVQISALKPNSTFKFTSTAFVEADGSGPTNWKKGATDDLLRKTVIGTIYTVEPELEAYCESTSSQGADGKTVSLDSRIKYNPDDKRVTFEYTPKDTKSKVPLTYKPTNDPTLYASVATYPWAKRFRDARSAKAEFYKSCSERVIEKYRASRDEENLTGLRGKDRMLKALNAAIARNATSGFCELRIKKDAVPKEWKNGVDFQPSGVVTVAAAPTKKGNVYTIPLSDPENKIDSLGCVDTKSLADVLYTLRMGNVSRIKYDKPTREALSLSSTEDASFDLNSATVDVKGNTKVTKKLEKPLERAEPVESAAQAVEKKSPTARRATTDRAPSLAKDPSTPSDPAQRRMWND